LSSVLALNLTVPKGLVSAVPQISRTLHWQDGEPEFSGSIRVESSD
jgi:hypothetical protein